MNVLSLCGPESGIPKNPSVSNFKFLKEACIPSMKRNFCTKVGELLFRCPENFKNWKAFPLEQKVLLVINGI